MPDSASKAQLFPLSDNLSAAHHYSAALILADRSLTTWRLAAPVSYVLTGERGMFSDVSMRRCQSLCWWRQPKWTAREWELSIFPSLELWLFAVTVHRCLRYRAPRYLADWLRANLRSSSSSSNKEIMVACCQKTARNKVP